MLIDFLYQRARRSISCNSTVYFNTLWIPLWRVNWVFSSHGNEQGMEAHRLLWSFRLLSGFDSVSVRLTARRGDIWLEKRYDCGDLDCFRRTLGYICCVGKTSFRK